MAVIDTSMDMPKSCYECPKRNVCSFARWNGWIDNKRDEDCPLKSADEMMAEIDNMPFYIDGYDIEYISKAKLNNIIHKYCDKEPKE